MTTTPSQRTAGTARPRGRPAMPLDRIIATALAIVDDQGADALSMRTLAQQLNSGTATLYRHFESRPQLVAQVVDAVLGEIDVDAAAMMALPWRQACEATARAMFDVLSRHPNVAPLLTDRIPVGPNAAAGREMAIAAFLRAGFSTSVAARAYTTLARYVLGFAIQAGGSSTDGAGSPAPALDPRAYPATATVAEHLPVPLADEFTFGLDLIMDGLSQLRTGPGQGG